MNKREIIENLRLVEELLFSTTISSSHRNRNSMSKRDCVAMAMDKIRKLISDIEGDKDENIKR